MSRPILSEVIDVCTCGRSRGSEVHADGALNGHAFEEWPRVFFHDRWQEINAVNSELASAIYLRRDTPEVLRLLKRLAELATVPEYAIIEPVTSPNLAAVLAERELAFSLFDRITKLKSGLPCPGCGTIEAFAIPVYKIGETDPVSYRCATCGVSIDVQVVEPVGGPR